MRSTLFLLLGFAACAEPTNPDDVVGPFTGEPRRFVVEKIQLPMTNTFAREWAEDLNGDHTGDNQLGMVIGTLATQGDVTEYGDQMVEAGAIASSVIITADDFTNDPTVSVLYLGADGDTGIEVGGSLENGVFTPNRTRETSVPGAASLHLPVFVSADPSIIPAIGLEIELTADGAGGFDAELHGLVPHDQVVTAAYAGISQMLAEEPREHVGMLSILDSSPRDGVVMREEFAQTDLIKALLAPDVTYRGQETLSLGFRVHLRACAEGTCTPAPRASCFDRVRDGSETGVDCGGTCRTCAAGQTCSAPTDCESGVCESGVCGAPSCSNGVRDGVETDVDCGFSCGDCAVGKTCLRNADCASGQCGPPCEPGSLFCDSGISFETCR
ncbi:MAG: hypothetical protein HOV81_17640 [Kofleriaceae bacterium]|nr:hypothetical protein [Kofleriaceae bacterium]